MSTLKPFKPSAISKAAGILLFLLLSSAAFSQAELYVFGVVKDFNSGDKLEDITITVTASGQRIDQVTTKSNGKYEFFLPLGKLYMMKFSGDDLVAKKVQLDSRNIPEENAAAGFSMNIEMTLFQKMEGLDTSLLDDPIGKAKYDPEKATMEFDFEYTRKIQGKIKDMMKAVEERNEKEQELEENFADFMTQGKEDLSDKDYESAVENFQSALDLKPKDQKAKDKLDEAQDKWDEKKAKEQAEEQYSNLLDKADSFFRTEDFEKAVEKYNAALEIKPEETYPQEQITAAEEKLDELASKKKRNKKYNKLVGEGNSSMEAENYQEAIASYDAALEVKPLGEEAQDKKEKAKELLEQKKQQAARKDQYDAAVAAADGLFEEEKYQESIGKYKEAQEILPDETYPQEQIDKANSKIAQNAKREEYDQVITEADTLLAEENFQNAIDKYKVASEMLPEKEYPKNKIEEARGLLEQRKAQRQKEKEFTALINEGDEAMSGEDYETAVSKFGEALGLKPGNDKAKDKKQAAQKALDAKKAKQATNKEYSEIIAEADSYFKQEQLKEAKKQYSQAQQVKPGEQYPADQIAAIEKQLAALDEKEKEYSAFMEAGNTAMDDENYKLAVDKFEAALGVKPEDEAAKSKKEEAESLRQKALKNQEVQAEYEGKITDADAARDKENFKTAKSLYEEAASLKPDETYPTEQIAAIEDMMAKRKKQAAKEKQQHFEELVAQGDEFGDKEAFDKAVNKYEAALEVFPDSTDVQDKIDEMKRLEKKKLAAKNKQQQFEELIAQAETKAGDGDLKGAISLYEEATGIISDNKEAKDRLEELRKKLNEQKAAKKQDRFDDFVARGELNEENNELKEAVTQYEQALEIFPGNEDISQRVTRLNAQISANKAQKQMNEQYAQLLQEAQKQANKEEYTPAISKMKEALELKPSESYPEEQIGKWKKLRKELEAEQARKKAKKEKLAIEKAEREKRKKRSQNYDASIEEGDTQFEAKHYDKSIAAYEDALNLRADEYYPKSMIEKVKRVKAKREEANKKQQELTAARDQRQKEARSKSSNFKRVRGNSEDEAEKFMREARQADKKQKYDNIKEQKKAREKHQKQYAETAAETRANAHEDAEEMRKSGRFKGQKALQDKQANDMMEYKATLEENKSEAAQKHLKTVRDHNKQINNEEEARRERTMESREARQKAAGKYMEKNESYNKSRQQWAQGDLDELREAGKKFSDKKENLKIENTEAIERRAENAQKTIEKREAYENYISRKAGESAKQNQQQQKQFNKKRSQLQAEKLEQKGNVSNNQKKIEEQKRQKKGNREAYSQLSDARRDINRTEAQKMQDNSRPKQFDEYQRSQLAEKYPEGVTEESSTMGNKVIIKRIVVRGNKGDKYKKVVDKSGNYYFKNGQSITEQTWYLETVAQFE